MATAPLSLYREATLRTSLLLRIDALQNPPDCRTASLYVYVPTGYTSGLGSQVRGMANSMLQAIALNRTFVADAATSAYVHPHRCARRTYDCLLQPLSKCSMDDALADVPTEVKAGFKTEMTGAEKIVHLPRLSVPAGAGHPRVISSRTSCFQPTDGQLAAIERAAVTLRPTSDDPRWARLRERHLFFENDLGDDVGPTLGGSDGGAVRPARQ